MLYCSRAFQWEMKGCQVHTFGVSHYLCNHRTDISVNIFSFYEYSQKVKIESDIIDNDLRGM